MTARIALVMVFIVPAAMAYPWFTTEDRCTLGVAVAVAIIVFAWWRGQFVTTLIGNRLAVWRRNHHAPRSLRAEHRATVLLRLHSDRSQTLPLAEIAAYTHRFGIRADKVRVTSVDEHGARRTWVAVTLDAADNLAALTARSPDLPLRETVQIVGRRLADHLRERGLRAVIVDDAVGPLAERGRETWRGMRDASGILTAYGIPVAADLDERLSRVWSHTAGATWTALEFAGTPTHLTVTAVCAFRFNETRPAAPPGLDTVWGAQQPLLAALDPRSDRRLGGGRHVAGRLDTIAWHVDLNDQPPTVSPHTAVSSSIAGPHG